MSQNETILNHLRTHRGITSIEAVNLYGITRLAARISDLKRMGHKIITGTAEVPTRAGKTARVAVYRLYE